MSYRWKEWLENWRQIANEASPKTRTSILMSVGGEDYEVLCVSRFWEESDADKRVLKTTIREFNDKRVSQSRSTRDLGLPRVITNYGKPAFLIEPGAEAVEWRAATEGVPVKELVKTMRGGDLGRHIRRLDRKAKRAATEKVETLEEEIEALQGMERSLRREIEEKEEEVNELRRITSRQRENIVELNCKQGGEGPESPGSGPLESPIEKARKRGYKATSNKPLPGTFEGRKGRKKR